MTELAGLDFLRLASSRRVYVVDGVVLAARDTRRGSPLTVVARLDGYAKVLGRRGLRSPRPELGRTEEALKIAGNVDQLKFCLSALVPTLHALDPEPPRPLPALSKVYEAYKDVSRASLALLAIEQPSDRSLVRRLSDLIGAPCMIAGQVITPLELARGGGPTEAAICFNDVVYRESETDARSIASLAVTLDSEMTSPPPSTQRTRFQLERTTQAFLDRLAQLLALYEPTRQDSPVTIYKDRTHELVLGNGELVLIRGPISDLLQRTKFFVLLTLTGRTRSEWISVLPLMTHTRSMLWTSNRARFSTAICMGDRAQYQHLHSSLFTDAEAVIHWLDAGVMVATGRTARHRVPFRGRRPTNEQLAFMRRLGSRR